MNLIQVTLFIIIAAVNSAVQLLIKKGSLTLAPVLSGSDSLLVKISKVITNPFIIGAVFLLGSGMFLWLRIVSKVELSKAYPINIALTVIITSVISIILFQESVSFLKIFGVVLIVIGLLSIFFS